MRDLIDSGVFVFAGGSEGPRGKHPESNPIQQFKLTFRKIFGLSNFIGLGESDRFELDSIALEEWLDKPTDGKKILVRNLGRYESPAPAMPVESVIGPDATGEGESEDVESGLPKQQTLFGARPVSLRLLPLRRTEQDLQLSPRLAGRLPSIATISLDEAAESGVDTVVIALGFEERCYRSAERILRRLKPLHVAFVKFALPGHGMDIVKLVEGKGITHSIVEYSDVLNGDLPELPGRVLVDVSGLPKAAIFRVLRSELKGKGQVMACRTEAQTYYPKETEIEGAIRADVKREHDELLRRLTGVSMGESGGYSIGGLLSSDADQSRRRAVCCFASAKYERLLTFLYERAFDSIEIGTPSSKTNRSGLARIAAEIAAKNFSGATVTGLDANDVHLVLGFIASRYQQWYVRGGFNFDLAMTGSKPESMACAAASAVLKVGQCWYVSPNVVDPLRFSTGVGLSHYYHMVMPRPRVFLCHASNDKPAVRTLHKKLRDDGFYPWLDEVDLLPGQEWEAEISSAVRSSAVVLVCLSRESITKEGFVQKEIKYALDVAQEKPDGTIFVVPVRLEECEVPARLRRWQWVDLYEEGGYNRLLAALRLS